MDQHKAAMVSVIILTYNRSIELSETLDCVLKQDYCNKEVIVVDNASNDGTDEVIPNNYPTVAYYRLDANKGVCEGRNFGIMQSRGQYLVFLDDDAIFSSNDALTKIVEKMESDPKIGCLALRIINAFSKEILSKEFPHPDLTKSHDEMEVGYFVGAGFVLRASILERTGGFPEHFFYSMEELDLSYRVLAEGYVIMYYPIITVYHKASPKGRLPSPQSLYYAIRNRFMVAGKYLPASYLMCYLFVWLVYFLLISSRKFNYTYYFRAVSDGWVELMKIIRGNERKVLSKQTIRYIRKVRGRLFY